MMVEQLPERTHAHAVQRLHKASQDYGRARQQEVEARRALRQSVRLALRVGVSSGRIRHATGLSLLTIGLWGHREA